MKKALITGASSGIGKALASLLSEKGYHLILVARNKEKLEQVAKNLKTPAETASFDLSTPQGQQGVKELIHRHVPELVINNAGFGLYGPILNHPTQKFRDMMEVNALAVMELSIEAARALVQAKKEGVILNVSSAAAFQIFPGFSIYASGKTFVNHFSESFDYELRPHGIRVLTACPGRVKTDFQAQASEGKSSESQDMMSVDFAAQEIWNQIETKKTVHIFNFRYRFLTFLSRYILPKAFVKRSVYNYMMKHYPK